MNNFAIIFISTTFYAVFPAFMRAVCIRASVRTHTYARRDSAHAPAEKNIFYFCEFLDKNVAFLSIAPAQLKGAEGD